MDNIYMLGTISGADITWCYMRFCGIFRIIFLNI